MAATDDGSQFVLSNTVLVVLLCTTVLLTMAATDDGSQFVLSTTVLVVLLCTTALLTLALLTIA